MSTILDKKFREFCSFFPTEHLARRAASLVPYDPSLHPTLVNIVQSGSIIIQPHFGGEGRRGRICSCQCFKELYLDTSIHMATSIFLNIFYQDCSQEDMLCILTSLGICFPVSLSTSTPRSAIRNAMCFLRCVSSITSVSEADALLAA